MSTSNIPPLTYYYICSKFICSSLCPLLISLIFRCIINYVELRIHLKYFNMCSFKHSSMICFFLWDNVMCTNLNYFFLEFWQMHTCVKPYCYIKHYWYLQYSHILCIAVKNYETGILNLLHTVWIKFSVWMDFSGSLFLGYLLTPHYVFTWQNNREELLWVPLY